jgi:hypothetical protein
MISRPWKAGIVLRTTLEKKWGPKNHDRPAYQLGNCGTIDPKTLAVLLNDNYQTLRMLELVHVVYKAHPNAAGVRRQNDQTVPTAVADCRPRTPRRDAGPRRQLPALTDLRVHVPRSDPHARQPHTPVCLWLRRLLLLRDLMTLVSKNQVKHKYAKTLSVDLVFEDTDTAAFLFDTFKRASSPVHGSPTQAVSNRNSPCGNCPARSQTHRAASENRREPRSSVATGPLFDRRPGRGSCRRCPTSGRTLKTWGRSPCALGPGRISSGTPSPGL